MKTSNSITKINSLNLEISDQLDFKKIPIKKTNISSYIPNNKDAIGFVLGGKKDGINLTIVSFNKEFFPYENKLSIHIAFLNQKKSFIASTSLLYSFILICNKMNVNDLISRHSKQQLDSLLMLLDLNFHVVEFSKNSIPHVVIEKNFIFKKNIDKEEEYFSAFKNNYSNKKIDIKRNQISSKISLNKAESRISNSISNINAFSKLLNIDYGKFPKTFQQLDKLCRLQNNIKGTTIGSGEKTYYFIEINNLIGALMCPKTYKARHSLKSVSKTLHSSNSQVLYTNIHDDWINSILFLSGFILASKSDQQLDLLWKWERL